MIEGYLAVIFTMLFLAPEGSMAKQLIKMCLIHTLFKFFTILECLRNVSNNKQQSKIIIFMFKHLKYYKLKLNVRVVSNIMDF